MYKMNEIVNKFLLAGLSPANKNLLTISFILYATNALNTTTICI